MCVAIVQVVTASSADLRVLVVASARCVRTLRCVRPGPRVLVLRSRLFACVRARLHPRDVFSRRPTDYRPVASAKTRQLSAVAVVAFPLRHMLLSTNRAHSIGQHNTVFAHLIVSCVGCRVPYACLRFVCGACNTIITCRSGEMGRGWAFHGPPPSRHSLSSGVCTHSRAPGAALRQH
jgi:hypothetical protein